MGTSDVSVWFMGQLSVGGDVTGLRIPNGAVIGQLSLNLVDFIAGLRQIVVKVLLFVIYLVSEICLTCELMTIKCSHDLNLNQVISFKILKIFSNLFC